MKNRYLYLLVALLLTTVGLRAESLTLQQCREMALSHNRDLKSQSQRVLAAEDMASAYRTNRLPNFAIDGNYLYTTQSFEATMSGGYLPTFVPDASGALVPNVSGVAPDGTPIFKEYAYMPDQNFEVEFGSMFNIAARATLPIYMGGKVNTAIKLAELGVDVANIERRRGEAEVIVEVDKAFYSLLKVEDMLVSADKYMATVEEFLRQVGNAYSVGMTTKNDQLKVEVRLNEAKLMKRKAENGVLLARMNLCQVIGKPLATRDVELVDEFNVGEIADRENLDITARPEYEMLQRQIEAMELKVKLSQSDFRPSLRAIASYGYANGATLNDKKLLNGASFAGGVMLSVPIFHWGEGHRKVSASEREVEIAKNQFEDLSEKMTLELMQSITRFEEATYEVDLTESAVAQAEENMRLSGNQYTAGMETIADYLESQALWQKSMSDMVEARASQRLAYSQYLRASGAEIQ